ncbi:Uncharacterized protein APZ42_030912 [Daphnia magna]|uniref:Uncharacterized protein n=1 Tax=Daphnia magna TaxID=35525 RepID=A0A164NFE2_9CRUS|nr:Uncharacterized protein APZ42_030912 [Daphnia magna]
MSPLHVCVEWWSVKIVSGAGNGGRFDVYDCVIVIPSLLTADGTATTK